MGRMGGLSWISSTLGKFRNRTLRFKFAQFPRYPNFACGNELRCTSCFRQLNTYRNPPNPLLGFASQGSTTLQTPQNKILGSKSHRVFYGADDGNNIELFGEDSMPILLPDTGMYTYKNLICIMKQCTQTYYNVRRILGLECA